MENQSLVKNNKQRLSFRKKLALGLGSLLILVVLLYIGLFAYELYGSGISIFGKSLNIEADEIPMYPNAQNITNEYPLTNIPEIHTWNFTTNDTPEIVWKFYVTEMGHRWGFYDSSSPQSSEKTLSVNSCPFYSLYMTSILLDNSTYSITIHFRKQLCM